VRGDREGLNAVEYGADRAHVLLQRVQDRRCVPENVVALRGGDRDERRDSGENERGAVDALVIHDDTRARAETTDELRPLATEPTSMSICLAWCDSRENAKYTRHIRGRESRWECQRTVFTALPV
jgi:hypothetical protein